MKQFNMMDIAMGAILLASKVEEVPLRLRDAILVFDYLEQRAKHFAKKDPESHMHQQDDLTPLEDHDGSETFTYMPSSYYSNAYYDTKDALMVAEMQILKRLGFDVQVNLPHALMVNYLQVLGVANQELEGTGSSGTAAQVAWNYLNDAYVPSLTQTAVASVLSFPTPCDRLRINLFIDTRQ